MLLGALDYSKNLTKLELLTAPCTMLLSLADTLMLEEISWVRPCNLEILGDSLYCYINLEVLLLLPSWIDVLIFIYYYKI